MKVNRFALGNLVHNELHALAGFLLVVAKHLGIAFLNYRREEVSIFKGSGRKMVAVTAEVQFCPDAFPLGFLDTGTADMIGPSAPIDLAVFYGLQAIFGFPAAKVPDIPDPGRITGLERKLMKRSISFEITARNQLAAVFNLKMILCIGTKIVDETIAE